MHSRDKTALTAAMTVTVWVAYSLWVCLPHWVIAQKFSLVTMQYLVPFMPINTVCPGSVSLFFFLWLVAYALQENLSVSILAHISSLTFARLFNHNQIMHSEMSHIPALWIDMHVFTVGFVINETVFGKRYNSHNCSVTVNKEILWASIHSQTGKSDQIGSVCHSLHCCFIHL